MLATRFRFANEVEKCAATMRAMNCIPCEVSLSITIEKGVATIDGHIQVLIKDTIDTARLAMSLIEGAANLAAVTSSGSSAKLTLTQTWDWN